MSTSAAIALILATFFLGLVSFFWLGRLANDVAAQVITGVVGGVPISLKYRRLLLYQTWINNALAGLASVAFGVFVVLKIADYATDPGIKPVAYLAAFIGGVTVLASVPTFLTEFVAFRAALVESKRD